MKSFIIIIILAAIWCALQCVVIASSNTKSTAKVGYKVNSVNSSKKYKTVSRSSDDHSQHATINTADETSHRRTTTTSTSTSNSSEQSMHDESMSRDSIYYQVSIVCRAIYLFFIYFPTICTAGIAYFSQAFRDQVWFAMLASTIAKSGAVGYTSY